MLLWLKDIVATPLSAGYRGAGTKGPCVLALGGGTVLSTARVPQQSHNYNHTAAVYEGYCTPEQLHKPATNSEEHGAMNGTVRCLGLSMVTWLAWTAREYSSSST